MKVILGIDAAWTATEPSGVALVAGESGKWQCLCVAPSYDSFLACATGQQVDWRAGKFKGSLPDVGRLISAARSIAGEEPTLVAIDMPVSHIEFSDRRRSDQAVSEVFGGKGCSTHSPSSTRPGSLGAKLMADLDKAGYPLATCSDAGNRSGHRTIEVYPHPALLILLNRFYRVPYKVSKSSKYWP
jgi:predicted RNase H-like nuclease